MKNTANCPNCEKSFEFSRADVYMKRIINIEGKTYRVYHYKKICSCCNESIFMKFGKSGENNGKWLVSKQ